MSILSWIKEVCIETNTSEVTIHEQAQTQSQSDEEIKSSPAFKRAFEELKPVYIWMTLAGGEPILPPIFSSDKRTANNGTTFWNVTLKKHGYGLWIGNLNKYQNATEKTEFEKALDAFAIDLFGNRAEEMCKLVSIEYIADHLITLENVHCNEADFYLTYTTSVYLNNRKELDLLCEEIYTAKI